MVIKLEILIYTVVVCIENGFAAYFESRKKTSDVFEIYPFTEGKAFLAFGGLVGLIRSSKKMEFDFLHITMSVVDGLPVLIKKVSPINYMNIGNKNFILISEIT
jgi:hypothetical protein